MNNSTIGAIALLGVIAIMIVPIPAVIVDLGLATSFAFSILILSMTLFVHRPLDFSIFPTLLLVSLTLRLALNISSTKLIIGEGHTGVGAAGDVIEGFANFIMTGNLFLGIVIFSIFLIVNFMVINKGASRMAEVSARFALDGMPGKQLAIDSDLSSGAISFSEAKERRRVEQDEAAFLGSLDGASKFVKGDAVAGLLITLLNLIVGVLFGVMKHKMDVGEAFESYAILTVGDGLVSQIPAVIVSISAAILLSRGGIRGSTDAAVIDQFSRYPQAILIVGCLLIVLGVLPGLPLLPFAIGGFIFLLIFGVLSRRSGVQKETRDEVREPAAEKVESIGDLLDLDTIHIEFSAELVNLVLDDGTGLDLRIANMRRHIALQFGVILPDVRLTDNASLGAGEYVFRIQGVEAERGMLLKDHFLVLNQSPSSSIPDGFDVLEPVYGAEARWINESYREQVVLDGVTVVSPIEVLATHLLELVKRNLSRVLTLRGIRRLLNELENVNDTDRAQANKKLLDEFIPDKVPLDCLHAVLRLLLDEQVSIRNLELIIEAIAEARTHTLNSESICEYVRQRLGFQLVAELRSSDGTVPLVQLSPEWENVFQAHQVEVERGLDVALPPEMFNRLGDQMAEKLSDLDTVNVFPAVVTNTRRRRFLKTVMRAKGLNNPVLSFEELGVDARPSLMGLVEI